MELAKIMAMEDAETPCKTFGWFYYKRRKDVFGVTKNHYLPPGKWQNVMRQSYGGTVRYLACSFY